MALLFIDSFDHYDGTAFGASHVMAKWTTGFLVAKIAVGQGRCGTNCMDMDTFVGMTKGLPFGSASTTIGFAMKVLPNPNSISPVRLSGTSGRTHLSLTYHADDGSMGIYADKHPLNADPEFLGRTAPDVIRQSIWYFIEFQATIDHTVGGAVLRVNNDELLNITNFDTVGDNADASPAVADLRSVTFSCPSNAHWYFDDLYILDSTGSSPWNTFLGDCRVEYLRPRAPGSAQEWGVVGASSHWQAVDDNYTPDDDATYLSTTSAGVTDTQLYRPTGLPSGPIFGAQLSLLARKTDNGPRALAPVIRQGGSEHIGTTQFPSVNLPYRYLHQIYPVNPITGSAWTIAEINADEYGVKVTE